MLEGSVCLPFIIGIIAIYQCQTAPGLLEGSVCRPFIIVITGPHPPGPGIAVKWLIVFGTPIAINNIAGRDSGICLP